MSRRVSLIALWLLAVASLPGCAVSLFSDVKQNPEAKARVEYLELRMDRVDAELALRSRSE